MLLTRYAPLRRSPSGCIATPHAAPRLACVKPAASVHPEPGSNSSLYNNYYMTSSMPDAYLSIPVKKKESTLLDFLSFRYFLLVQNLSFSIFNELDLPKQLSFFPKGNAKIRTFWKPPKFFDFFLLFLREIWKRKIKYHSGTCFGSWQKSAHSPLAADMR